PIQLPGSTWGGAHPQSLRSTLPSSITPAHHRTCITADTPSYFVKRVTRIQQCQGPLTPIFEQVGAPFQSGHRCSAPETPIIAFFMQKSIIEQKIRSRTHRRCPTVLPGTPERPS